MMAENITVSALDPGDLPAFLAVFEAAWGFDLSDERRRHIGLEVSGENLIGAYLGGELAGTAMSFSMELTVPGEVRLPVAGVSHVAVHPLRRRRGVLRARGSPSTATMTGWLAATRFTGSSGRGATARTAR